MSTLPTRLATWKYVIDTANLPAGAEMDAVSKWLIVTRAAVFSMTFTSGLIGGLLAIGHDPAAVHYGYLALAVIGLVVAHAANNMINDYFDLEGGVDTDSIHKGKRPGAETHGDLPPRAGQRGMSRGRLPGFDHHAVRGIGYGLRGIRDGKSRQHADRGSSCYRG